MDAPAPPHHCSCPAFLTKPPYSATGPLHGLLSGLMCCSHRIPAVNSPQRGLPDPMAYSSPLPLPCSSVHVHKADKKQPSSLCWACCTAAAFCRLLSLHSRPSGGAPSPVGGDLPPSWRACQESAARRLLQPQSCECTETRVTGFLRDRDLESRGTPGPSPSQRLIKEVHSACPGQTRAPAGLKTEVQPAPAHWGPRGHRAPPASGTSVERPPGPRCRQSSGWRWAVGRRGHPSR